jgi:hypothetical protein
LGAFTAREIPLEAWHSPSGSVLDADESVSSLHLSPTEDLDDWWFGVANLTEHELPGS